MSFVIESLRSSKTPWEIFQAVHANSKACFFLDSPDSDRTRYLKGQGRSNLYSYIGMDPDLEIRLDEKTVLVEGERREKYPAEKFFPAFKNILKKHQIRGRNPHPFFTGGFIGYFGYETADLCDKIQFRAKLAPDMPRLYFGLFRNVIVYDQQKRVYHLVINGHGAQSVERGVKKLKSYFAESSARSARPFKLKKFAAEMTQGRFTRMVRKAKEYIAAGDIYQANLSQRFSFGYGGSSLALYGKLRAINPSPFSCFLKTRELEVVSSSPERLIRKKGDLCETRPIAGTCPARGSSGKLSEWRKRLLRNEKERAEHLMLVDLERNDLGRVCGYRSVKVEEFMTLEKYSHVVHLVSRVTGRLKKGKDVLDLIRAVFPGGTITGCPKIRCMEIIDELEPVRRGLYTGSLGYIDRYGDMDLNIVIRTLLLKNGKGHLQVGAGIVHDSDPEKEYEETLHKAEALIQALREADTRRNEQSATLNEKNQARFSRCALPVER
ncbi:MAG: anthranilate synthase component I family protein [Candidatus Omnitrophota bacterium]